jgi:hypothetical protein
MQKPHLALPSDCIVVGDLEYEQCIVSYENALNDQTVWPPGGISGQL